MLFSAAKEEEDYKAKEEAIRLATAEADRNLKDDLDLRFKEGFIRKAPQAEELGKRAIEYPAIAPRRKAEEQMQHEGRKMPKVDYSTNAMEEGAYSGMIEKVGLRVKVCFVSSLLQLNSLSLDSNSLSSCYPFTPL
jgi:hypothetical protein